jgi:adenosylhomocysteine nucleosidase
MTDSTPVSPWQRAALGCGAVFTLVQLTALAYFVVLIFPRFTAIDAPAPARAAAVAGLGNVMRVGNFLLLLGLPPFLGFVAGASVSLRRGPTTGGVFAALATIAGVAIAVIWPIGIVLTDVELDLAQAHGDPAVVSALDALAPYTLALSALPRAVFLVAVSAGARSRGLASTPLVYAGYAIAAVSVAGSATLLSANVFPILAMSTLAFEIWVGLVALALLRRLPKASSVVGAAAVAAVLLAAMPAGAQGIDGRPVVVQGAMQIEVEQLARRLDGATEDHVGAWTFWRGTIDGFPVVVSKTLKGVTNAAAATAIAVEHFHPLAIINQGTAGGHDASLHVYDIVIGTSAINLGAFRSRYRPAGSGSNSLEWTPLDLTASDGSAGNDPNARRPTRFAADNPLLAAARSVTKSYTKGRIVEGVIGTSDVWNDEIDRIARFNTEYGTIAEEMETASAAQIAAQFSVPFLGIRILSDNITNGGAYDPKTSEACEDYVFSVVRAYVATLKR